MLLPGLLWRRISTADDGPRIRPAEYRAPTWSWAAIDGEIEYRDTVWGRKIPDINYVEYGGERITTSQGQISKFILAPTILEAFVKLSSDTQPFGGVSGGSIKLEGPVAHVKGYLYFHPGDSQGTWPHRARVRKEGQIFRMQIPGLRNIKYKDGTNEGFIECWPDAQGDMALGDVQLCLLALTGQSELRVTRPGLGFWIKGLILRRVDSTREVYHRVGFFDFESQDPIRLLERFKTRISLEII